ncbi:hypothetical protein Q9314_03735 [Shinella sumterensis]|nr:hypothetical protein Q9314_03735 [Shinella sumterensis]
MMTALAVLAGIVTYFVTMAVLLAISSTLQFNVPAFGFLNVQPYRSMAKWAIIGASVCAAYAAFLGISN